ncbi:hypothetical protein ASG78_14280 [Nostocoides sp. Soil756]|nr:hypothetical protein ASG78_14280 [Tetrasphaera sp. Soil756]
MADPKQSEPYEPAVFINWIDLDADEWDGVWQDGPEHRSLTGTKREVEEWAASLLAVRYWIYDGSEFVPWDPGTRGSAG